MKHSKIKNKKEETIRYDLNVYSIRDVIHRNPIVVDLVKKENKNNRLF